MQPPCCAHHWPWGHAAHRLTLSSAPARLQADGEAAQDEACAPCDEEDEPNYTEWTTAKWKELERKEQKRRSVPIDRSNLEVNLPGAVALLPPAPAPAPAPPPLPPAPLRPASTPRCAPRRARVAPASLLPRAPQDGLPAGELYSPCRVAAAWPLHGPRHRLFAGPPWGIGT